MAKNRQSSRILTIACVAVVIGAVYLAKPVLVPLTLAVLVSFLLAPLVARLERWHFGRTAATVTVMALVLSAVGFLVYVIGVQVTATARNLPAYEQQLRTRIRTVRESLAGPFSRAAETVEELGKELSDQPSEPASSVPVVQMADEPSRWSRLSEQLPRYFLSLLLSAGVVSVFAFFMLLQLEDLRDRFMLVTGGDQIYLTTQALAEASHKISEYLLRYTVLNGIHGLAVGLGLYFIGVPGAALFGVLAALLRFIPYAGPWISAVMPICLSLAVFDDWNRPLATVGLFVVLELITNNLVEPFFYGAGIGLSPVAILVSAFFWTWMWGTVGLVLATPLTVCLAVLGKHVPKLRFLNVLLGNEPVVPVHVRLYQRLVSKDKNEAWNVIERALKNESLEELYDSTMLPVLSLSEVDLQRGNLDAQTAAFITTTMRAMIERARELARGAEDEARKRAGIAVDPSLVARPPRLVSLCLPARDEADVLAGMMLSDVLAKEEIEVEVISNVALASEMLDLVERRGVKLVYLSSVPPSAGLRASYLYKRLITRFPDLRIVIGVWNVRDRRAAESALPSGDNRVVVTSLAEAVRASRELLEVLRFYDEPSEPPPRARTTAT